MPRPKRHYFFEVVVGDETSIGPEDEFTHQSDSNYFRNIFYLFPERSTERIRSSLECGSIIDIRTGKEAPQLDSQKASDIFNKLLRTSWGSDAMSALYKLLPKVSINGKKIFDEIIIDYTCTSSGKLVHNPEIFVEFNKIDETMDGNYLPLQIPDDNPTWGGVVSLLKKKIKETIERGY